MCTGTVAAILYAYFLERSTIMVLAFVALIFLVGLDFIRLRSEKFNYFVFKIFGSVMRDVEKTKLSAQMYYALGLCFCAIVLPKPIAIQAALTLAWMDPAAALFGLRFGKRTWSQIFSRFFLEQRRIPISWGAKTIEGSLGGLVAGLFAGIVAWTGPWCGIPMEQGMWWPNASLILLLSFSGSLVGVIAEAWPSQWDDNATIPFFVGISVWIIAWLFAIPMVWA